MVGATLLGLLLLSSCTSNKTLGERQGPPRPAHLTIEPWEYGPAPATLLKSRHYNIYTTLPDQEFAREIAQVLEGGMSQYQRLTPGVAISTRPMNCYIFANRREWAEFTAKHTGPTAKIYLQINRGGYTLRDWFVAYDIGRLRTYAVAAHEGWHQFASRNFVGRLPPFLEEGIACMFEDVHFRNDLPQFNLSVNPQRAHSLRRAIEKRTLIPLRDLCTMHAGEVVSRSGSTIETFYAQNWAFAKFLWEGDGGRYRPAMLRLIRDTATGNLNDPSGSHSNSKAPWEPSAVPPLLERYLGMSMTDLSSRFASYIQFVAYEELEAQFAS